MTRVTQISPCVTSAALRPWQMWVVPSVHTSLVHVFVLRVTGDLSRAQRAESTVVWIDKENQAGEMQ